MFRKCFVALIATAAAVQANALQAQAPRFVYVFGNTQYTSIDAQSYQMRDGFPKDIATEWGWPAQFHRNVDAAVNWGNGHIYIFKGPEYIGVDAKTYAMQPGYPKRIADEWAWPAAFQGGIDAAVNWGNGNVYIFKGGEYIGVNSATFQQKPGYPKSIANEWGDWPGQFKSGIDAAVNWGNGNVYFFKGADYISVDARTYGLRAGFPLTIAKEWGWPPEFHNRLGAALHW